ncbi:MAG TPA: adenosylcobinamide-GDP ribazoletransferase [Trebonia sp.]|nr:adenosylcobinamide-GDP ribazoletransferase [Trebonia sp.]
MSWTRACRTAVSLFTVLPAGAGETLAEGDAARAVLWMPAVGLLLGVLGGAVVAGAGGLGAGDSGLRRLLGAALAIALVGLLTGGLHLDGLADTADGLGSRRPAPVALDIMRRSDVGPMGVATLVLVLLIQVTALAAVPRAAAAGLALVLAAVTGRVAVVLATGSDAARPGGFGALVAGRTTGRARAMTAVGLGCAIVAAGFGFGGPALAVRGLVAAAVGLTAGSAVRLTAVRRLGGVTGDVFGAVLEIAAAATLVTCALTA